VWTPEAERLVEDLIARLMATRLPEQTRSEVTRLNALPIGGSMWSAHYLRPTGEVVVVGEDPDRRDEDRIYTDRVRVLWTIVLGARLYPELRQLIPERVPGATACRCLQHPDIFGPDGAICPDCGGVGWLPPGG
jgi:hypothetical protein